MNGISRRPMARLHHRSARDLRPPLPFDGPLPPLRASGLARSAFRLAGVVLTLFVLVAGFAGFRASNLWGVLAVAGASTLSILAVLLARLVLEGVVTLFTIAELAREIAEQEAVVAVNTRKIT